MSAARTQFVVSASRLADGSVAYLAADRGWSSRFEDAARFDDAASRDEALSLAKADEAHVCNVHVFDVGVAADGSLMLSARERLRREGPDAVRRRLGLES